MSRKKSVYIFFCVKKQHCQSISTNRNLNQKRLRFTNVCLKSKLKQQKNQQQKNTETKQTKAQGRVSLSSENRQINK